MNQNDPYVVVEEPDVTAVLPDLIDVLAATRDNQPNLKRFTWLYLENPEGEAVVWTLRRRETGEMIGFTSCIPRRMIVNGRPSRCWIGADFSILPRYRSLGLALRLRRAAKTAIENGRADFLYSHPNDRMAVIHEKVGHQRIGAMIRLARLISVRPLLEERKQTRMLAGVASRILDPVLHAAGSEWRTATTGQVTEEQETRFDSEFDDLFQRESAGNEVIGVRDPRYLNWRYAQNPLQDYRLLTVRDSNILKGYLIYSYSAADNTANIQDIFPGQDAQAAGALLKELWKLGRQRQYRSISFTLLESSPLVPVLKRFNYSVRPETSQMFSYIPEGSLSRDMVYSSNSWYITVGDRDV